MNLSASPDLKEKGKWNILQRWNNWFSKDQRHYAPYIFISPFYILFLIFGLFPIIFSLYLSFHSWRAVGGLSTMEWVGLKNYKFLIADQWFWQSLWNTFILLIISGLPQHIIALPLAFILNSRLPRQLKQFLSSSYFFPYITSTVAIALIFSTIFGFHYGILNQLLDFLANSSFTKWAFGWLNVSLPINWLGRAIYIKPAVAIVVIWHWFGWNTILYLSGLQVISEELYEAARVDGAIFDEPFILTGGTGGVGRAGMTVAIYLYRTAFNWTQMGVAAAMSWLLFLIIIIFTLINYTVLRKGVLERRGE
ncbi:cytochrome C biogenesis protein [Candidatus Atribacteria bacterium HGW-Atribacteria-1]|nr:MAG: cytochrome C biogenesis protein [Candidatus Atribacteria bacterium HGW-Atribacteria-1]